MDISFSEQDLQFQEEIRAGLNGSEYPLHVREKQEKGAALSKQDMIDFHKFIHSKGWMGYNWPVEYGGTGWSPVQIYLFLNELALAQCPTILPFGLSMVGPVIYTFGNQEQKDRFLPDILEFNTWWCQGYSEPGSGSDLASLKTKAVLEGDHYIVNGSKTWTTLAQNADWIFCLVRTETTQKKQEGISFLLIDMNTPGIEVKPIITIDGDHEVNSVFFTDVKVPA
jgi:alkylation response protein AidB-like acyl-CoA dehydrogenase